MKKIIMGVALLGLSMGQMAQAEWVYIGDYGVDGPISTGFDVQQLPTAGDTIRAQRGMNLRDDRPQLENSWSLGTAVGVIHPGEDFVIEEVAVSRSGAAPGDVWARGMVKR